MVTLIDLRLISQKRRKLGMRYGLPTIFRRVELAFVQQTKEQTYKFTGSQRKCSFMLMISRFSIFLLMDANSASSDHRFRSQRISVSGRNGTLFHFIGSRILIKCYSFFVVIIFRLRKDAFLCRTTTLLLVLFRCV